MGNEGSCVALGLKVWKAQIDRADKLFGGLSSKEVLREIAPGRNRLLYLWGHLTAIHDAMLPLLGLSERLHPEFDVALVSNPDKSRAGIPSHEQVRQAWNSINGELSEGFERMSWADWLQRHSANVGRRFRKRYFAQSLRYPAEPYEPSVLAPRPGGSRTQLIDREASELASFRAQQQWRKTMFKRLEGKTAVVTGGTEGIGLATAKLFVKEGAYVFITGRRQKELDEAVKAIGTNVSGVQGDVAQLADLDRLYETVSKEKGRIDIIFANAGVGEFVPFGAVTEEHFDKLFNINVRGTLFTVHKALALLNDGGSIILNGSVASVKGTAAFGVYAASKAAVRSFVRTWTTDLKDRHIRSNVVSPGPINTSLANRQSTDVIARIVSTIPMGRMGEPEEVAKVALFLASDDSSFVTGIELFVDGGRAQI